MHKDWNRTQLSAKKSITERINTKCKALICSENCVTLNMDKTSKIQVNTFNIDSLKRNTLTAYVARQLFSWSGCSIHIYTSSYDAIYKLGTSNLNIFNKIEFL